MTIKAAVLGASGFAGAELLRILGSHPDIEVASAAASSQVGKPVAELYPALDSVAHLSFVSVEDALAADVELVFSSLPHNASMGLFSTGGPKVVDLGGDHRLDDALQYEEWFGEAHAKPESLASWVYGLTEFHRKEVSGADRVANPGCYATAALLVLAPLLAAGVIEGESIHIDAKSGVSGAGRAGGEGFDFCSANENLSPYTVTGHKHIAEIEQELALAAGRPTRVSFVPHLVPMNRGILASCSAAATPGTTQGDLWSALAEAFRSEAFVRILDKDLPRTKRLSGTNFAEVAVRLDDRTGRVLAFAAIDNLGKGAAGQAVQNANLMFGLPESSGLADRPLLP
ncbi:MAG TPA: N-acetyl-gamma-glutamyl-phosphate reductase [Actinomycetota bacterium]|nr:N-acetyl-gamma-glutamyl-phosphate reductase [Actinomycetota bacterium]